MATKSSEDFWGIIILIILIVVGIKMCSGCNGCKKEETSHHKSYKPKIERDETQIQTDLDNLKTQFIQKNVIVTSNGSLMPGKPFKHCFYLSSGITLSEIGNAFYSDLTQVKQSTNNNLGGVKLMFDLSARANEILDVNDIKRNTEFCLYSVGCFGFYIPDIYANPNYMTSRLLTGQIKFVKGEILQ